MTFFRMSPLLVEGVVASAPPKGALDGLDYYSYPNDDQRLNAPVVRLWGTTPEGQKVTAHIHGFFPYFYARPLAEEIEASKDWDAASDEDFARWCERVQLALEDALRRDAQDDNHVRSVLPARLTPVYGFYHVKRFARIELWDFKEQRRAAALLCDGLDELPRLQPYESHVDFHMRFFFDMGIFGVAPLVELRNARFRRADTGGEWDHERVRRERLFHKQDQAWCKPRTTAGLEIDAPCSGVVVATRAVSGVSELTAMPSLRELFDEESDKLRAAGLSDDDVRTRLAVAPEWTTPCRDAKESSCSEASPRVVNDSERDVWGAALDALRAVTAPTKSRLSTSQQVSQRSSVSKADSEAGAREQARAQIEAEQVERYYDGEDDDEDSASGQDEPEDDSNLEAVADEPDCCAPTPRRIRFSEESAAPVSGSRPARSCEVVVRPARWPPTSTAVLSELSSVNVPLHYTRERDASAKKHPHYKVADCARFVGDVSALPEFNTVCSLERWRQLESFVGLEGRRRGNLLGTVIAAPLRGPPSRRDVCESLKKKLMQPPKNPPLGPTPEVAARPSQPPKSTESASTTSRGLRANANVSTKACPVSLLALEVLAATRDGRLRPDPDTDQILAAVWRYRDGFYDDTADVTGVVVVVDPAEARDSGREAAALLRSTCRRLDVVEDETSLVRCVARLVVECNPDVLVGWDLERESFAYIVDRARKLSVSIELGRIEGAGIEAPGEEGSSSRYGLHGVEVRGRVSLNAWREVTRDDFSGRNRSDTLEAACQAVLKCRLPKYAAARLAERARAEAPAVRAHAVRHVARRCQVCLAILTALNTIGRAAEVARLFGMPLYDAIFRGSQHRVEAVLLRLAKPRPPGVNALVTRRNKNGSYFPDAAPDAERPWFAFMSPTRHQVANQPALEQIALTLEPNTKVYTEPVAVFDFRSLYPSMIIAYNLCFSTQICKLKMRRRRSKAQAITRRNSTAPPELKRPRTNAYELTPDEDDDVDDYYGLEKERNGAPAQRPQTRPLPAAAARGDEEDDEPATMERLGVVAHRTDDESAEALRTAERSGWPVFVAPNGATFASSQAREGLLPRALREILAARMMVKKTMKRAAAEGRKTETRILDARQLELKMLANVTYGYCSASFSGRMPCAELADAIVLCAKQTLEAAKTSAEARDAVVKYGDTDSLFIELPDRSLEKAVDWSHSFARQVTEANPPAVMLEFEYVFSSCSLVAKKNYAGIAHSSANDAGSFVCKGLAPIRRDVSPFVARTCEKIMRSMFETRDLSRAKAVFARAVAAAHAGTTPLADFVVRQQYKHGHYKRPATNTVDCVRRALDDRGNRTLDRERVAFVYLQNDAQHRHKQATDLETASRPNAYPPHVKIYVENQLMSTLDRILGPVGVNVSSWYHDVRRAEATRSTHHRDLPAMIRPDNWLACYVPPRTDDAVQHRNHGGIPAYFSAANCQLCNTRCKHEAVLCDECASRPTASLFAATTALRSAEAAHARLAQDCVSCAANPDHDPTARQKAMRRPTSAFAFDDAPCDSFDCPVAYARRRANHDRALAAIRLANCQALVADPLDFR